MNIKTWQERKEASGNPWRLPTRSYMQQEIDELRAELFVMTADRDSWADQVVDRIDDVLRFSNEVDRLKAQQEEIDGLRAELAEYREALRMIANPGGISGSLPG